jgi:hypothetical protein
MARIADVTGGAWKNEQGAYRLTRTAAAERAQEKREAEYRIKQIKTEIDRSKEIRSGSLTAEKAKELSSQLQKLREKNPQYAFSPYGEMNSPLNMAPTRRALLRIISLLDLSEVAMLDPGDRIAFSNKPNRMQRALPSSVDDVLSKYMEEQNVWADAINTVGEGSQSRFAGDPLDARTSLTAAPDRILLVANRSNSMAPVQFQLFLIDGEKPVGDASIWLGSDSIRKLSSQMMSSETPSGTKIKLRRETQLMLEATKAWQRPNQGPVPGPSADGVALLTHPEGTDPLALVATDGFIAVADSKHLNLIASLPDDLVSLNFMPNASAQTAESFIQMAETFGDLQSTVTGGWLTIKPNKEYSARHLRIDRDVLGKYLRSIADEGRASLDAQGEFALNAQPSDYDSFGMPMGSLLDLNSTQNIDKDWVSLKLWGDLSKDQRNDLIKGVKIPFRSLTPSQLALVSREAYGRSFKALSGRRVIGENIRLAMEPSECLPNGLPPDGTLSITAQASTALLASSTLKNVRMSYARVFDEQQLGSSLAYYEKAQPNSNPMFDRFQLIQRISYRFTYDYGGGVSDHSDLHDIVAPPGSEPLAFSDLPKAMQEKILAAKETAKSNPTFGPAPKTPPPSP